MIDTSLDRPIDVIGEEGDVIVFPHLLLDGVVAPEQFELYRFGADEAIQSYGLKNGLRKDIGQLVLSHYMVLQLGYMGIKVVFCQDAETTIDMTSLDSLLEIATARKEKIFCI